MASSIGSNLSRDWADYTQPECLSDLSYSFKEKEEEVPLARLVNPKTGQVIKLKVNIFERELFHSLIFRGDFWLRKHFLKIFVFSS